jgi:hypothetical protein
MASCEQEGLMRLIGFGGYATSGKDTAADILVNKYGYKKLYMSQVLEQALLALDPIITVTANPFHRLDKDPLTVIRYQEIHSKYGYDNSKQIEEVRTLLQKLGTEVGRNILGENVWVDAVFSQADKLMSEGFDVCVCGIRYGNELDAITSRKGLATWVDRGLAPVNSHTSDNALGPDDFDYILDNRGTIQYLENNLDTMISWT